MTQVTRINQVTNMHSEKSVLLA